MLEIDRENISDGEVLKVLRLIELLPLPSFPVIINNSQPLLEVDIEMLLQIVNVKGLDPVKKSLIKEMIETKCSCLKWKSGNKIYIPTVNKSHSRERDVGLVFDFDLLKIKRGGLAEDALDSFEAPSVHRPLWAYARLTSWLVSKEVSGKEVSRKARRILSSKSGQVSPIDIAWIFTKLEDVLDTREEYEERTKYGYSAEFRAWVSRIPHKLSNGVEIYRSVRFETRFRDPRFSREIISELEDPGAATQELSAPISTLRHESLKDLEAKALNHLEGRNRRITDSCWDSINAYLHWRSLLTQLKETPLSSDGEKYIDQLTAYIFKGSNKRADYIEWLEKGDLMQVLQAHVHLIERNEMYKFENFIKAKGLYFKVSIFFKRLKKEFPEFQQRYVSLGQSHLLGMLSYYYIPNWILLCIRLLFQLEFAWNRDTAAHLTSSCILRENGNIQLAPMKPKSQDTQVAWIGKDNANLITLIELLEEQDKRIRNDWKREGESLFAGWSPGKHYPKFVVFCDHRMIKRFIKAYDLPHFTNEQLRNQAGNTFYMQTKDPHATQALLGHGSLATTDEYLAQTINRLLNEASMFEFMQRLGASIVWAVDGDESLIRYGFSRNDVDQKLLFPVSDVSSLEVVDYPLCDQWISDDSTKIVIDADRISHAIRQKLYYQSNWERLYNENSERFYKVHINRVLFNHVLCRVIEESKHGPVYKKLAERIHNE